MPKQKKPPTVDVAASAALALFAQNLEAIRAWYRGSSHPGREVGHVVMNELVLANVATALALALKGQLWVAPNHNP